MDDFYIPSFDVLVQNMPQYLGPTSLLPAGINLDSMEEDGAGVKMDTISCGTTPFSQESDTDISSSQKSDSSLCFDFLKFGMRINSKGSIVDSEDDFMDTSDQSVAGVESILKTVSAQHAQLDQGAIYCPDSDGTKLPRSATPCESLASSFDDQDTLASSLVTPTKPSSEEEDLSDPLTPMANLKMLISAASPEIRHREMEQLRKEQQCKNEERILPLAPPVKRKRSQKAEENHIEKSGEADNESGQQGSRKEKSLGLLCHRFLNKFPEYPNEYEGNIQISLDEVAKELFVERRRIYDIVNVLESVEMVSRVAKNKYAWHGKTSLPFTLYKLKALGKMQKMDKEIERVRDGDNSHESSPRKRAPLSANDENNIRGYSLLKGTIGTNQNVRKDKSLGIMSQKFLMLFLVSMNDTINLDLAAKILIGDSSTDKSENANFKTKIRRLYDIANILTSLQLIQKVHVTETRGRKPAFQYIGPHIPELAHEENMVSTQRQISKHSLLDSVQNADTSAEQQSGIHMNKTETPGCNGRGNAAPAAPTKRGFSRHASFEQICQVAEQERNRLYFESRSQPTSPTKTDIPAKAPKLPMATIQPSLSPAKQKSFRHFVVIRGNKTDKESDGVKFKNTTVHRIPVAPVKTLKFTHQSEEPEQGNSSKEESTTITLTKEQLEAIVKTISDKKDETTQCVDAATQSSPALLSGLSAVINRDVHHGQTTVKIIQAPTCAIEQETLLGHSITSGVTTSKRSMEQASNTVQVKKRKIVSVVPSMKSTSTSTTSTAKYASQDVKVARKPQPVRKLYVTPQEERTQMDSTGTSNIQNTKHKVPTKAQLKRMPDAFLASRAGLFSIGQRSMPTSPTFQLTAPSPPIVPLPERPASHGSVEHIHREQAISPFSCSQSILAPLSLKGRPRVVQKNISYQPSVISSVGEARPQSAQAVLRNTQHLTGVTQVTPMAGMNHLTPVSGVVQFGGLTQLTPINNMTPLTHLVNGMAQLTPATSGMTQLTPVSGSQVMVTPTGCRMVSGIAPSSSTIINLQPFFRSPNHSQSMSPHPQEEVPVFPLSGSVGVADFPTRHIVQLKQVMQPLVLTREPQSQCTPTGQVLDTKMFSKPQHYTTPESALSLTTSASNIAATMSAFKPVGNAENTLSGNPTISLAARRLSLPKV